MQLPDGALGILKQPLPLGLLITADDKGITDEDVQADVDGATDDRLAKLGFLASPGDFRDHRCRNCGAKCPEALPGLVQVDVLSVLAPDANYEPRVLSEIHSAGNKLFVYLHQKVLFK